MMNQLKDFLSTLPDRQKIWLAAFGIILLTLISYGNSFQVPFIFDDIPTIQENETILHLWPITDALFPPPNSGLTTAGRPLVNLSLAVNYFLGKFNVTSYHIFNLGFHICAALAFLGIVRRTMSLSIIPSSYKRVATPLAVIVTALWSIHPLNTAAVTYIVQRAEILTSLFYLLTLYFFIRSINTIYSGRWLILSLLSCYLSVASKEVAATIPLLIFLYDRTFVAGSFREAWKERWQYYLGLLLSWGLQLLLIFSTGNRGGTAGFSAAKSTFDYTLTQSWAISNYLKLALWPSPLIFDYGAGYTKHFSEVALPCFLIFGLLAITGYGIYKHPLVGFLGASFFIVLAPSSSVVPVITQTVAEHRMYLPLTAVLTLFVVGLYTLLGKKSLFPFLLLITTYSLMTYQRNNDFKSHLSIWRDTAEKRPENYRAWKCLGVLISEIGHYTAALKMYDRAKILEPRDPGLYFNSANALGRLGRIAEAITEYKIAIQMQPGFADARNNLANIYLQNGQPREALPQLEIALKISPLSAQTHYNMGRCLQFLGNYNDAREHLVESLRLHPGFLPAVDALNALNSTSF